VKWNGAMRADLRRVALCAAIALTACSAKPPESQTYLAGRPIDLQELTAQDVARAVQITPRGDDVFFQAPPIQKNKLIDLRSAGKEIGISLGDVERVRYGYLFGVLHRPSNAIEHHVLFQSNFVVGNDRYASVSLPDGRPLQFMVARAPDPCVPNCFPVIEALIVAVPDDVLRASQTAGLPLTISLTDGEVINFDGLPAYVQGYLQAVDSYLR